jgi:hypothetical protein
VIRGAAAAAGLACVALFVASLATHCAKVGLSYDEGFNAAVAKNIATGFGWASSYHERIRFDPEVSSGPVVLLPLACAIRIFGHESAVPPWAATVENLAFLAALALVAFGARDERRTARVLSLLAAWALFSTGPRHWLWYRPLGEVPGALLLVAGTLLALDPRGRRRMAGALLLGLAPLAKAICILGLVFPSVAWLRARRAPEDPAPWKLLAICAAPSLAWLAFVAASLGRAFPSHVAAELSWLSAQGASHSPLAAHFAALPRYLGGWIEMSLIAALAIAWLVARRTVGETSEPAARLLLGTGALVLAWWILFERRADLRHLAVGFFCAVSGVALALPAIAARSRFVLVAAIALAAARVPRLATSLTVEETPTRADVEETTRALAGLERDPGTLLVGWRWWVGRAFEYTLDGSLHFRDASRLGAADLAGRTLYLVRSTDFWNREHDPAADRWAAECERNLIFSRGEFRVSRCERLPNQ